MNPNKEETRSKALTRRNHTLPAKCYTHKESGLFGWFAVNLRQSPQQSGIFLSGGSGWLKSPKKKPRYILATGARDGWGNHIRKPHQATNGYVTVCQAVPKADPWSVGRFHGVNLPQNVFMARGRGQNQRGKKGGASRQKLCVWS